MGRWLRNNGLTLALLGLFTLSISGQWYAGWRVASADAIRHGQQSIGLLAYAVSPEFISSVFENWKSEFLQMSAYVVLTAVLVQRGSAESKDLDDTDQRDAHLQMKAGDPKAPEILRWGPIWRAV